MYESAYFTLHRCWQKKEEQEEEDREKNNQHCRKYSEARIHTAVVENSE